MNKQQWQNRIDELEKELAELKANPPKREYGERWKPEIGERYWLDSVTGEVLHVRWYGDAHDTSLFKNFNIFQTKEEAEFARERTKVMRELDLWATDRYTPNEIAYGIFCDSDGKIIITPWFNIYTSHVFETKEIAQKAIEAVGVDRLKRYYFKVVE